MKFSLYQFTYQNAEAGRIDKFLAENLTDISRSSIQKLIQKGLVCVDGLPIEKSNAKVATGQVVSIEVPEQEDQALLAENIELDIIYIDANTIVINKPAGMVVHPGAGNDSGTVVNALLSQWPEIACVGDPERPGIVHRLDKETSGILLIARNQKAYDWYVSQFKNRKTKKTYLALVDGHPPTPEGRIEAPVLRDAKHRQRMAVGLQGQGRSAITEYFRIKNFRKHDYLEVHPLTGRTHQIRVHMAYLGCPITGDTIYGHKHPSIEMGRFFLHAQSLLISLPREKQLTTFHAKLPEDLQVVLDTLEDER
jgi:23S rRNA pseudouridine1911/1915/1917 synthase